MLQPTARRATVATSPPRPAVALKEPARKSAASIGTLRIMGLLLSSASTGAPGRLDSEVNEGDPIFERWTSLHIVITRGGTPLDCFFWLSRRVQVPSRGSRLMGRVIVSYHRPRWSPSSLRNVA